MFSNKTFFKRPLLTPFTHEQGPLEFPLPSPYLPTNFDNSAGLRYEAMEVKSCLESNRKESEIMPLSHTQIVVEIMEDVLKQLGAVNYKK